MFNKPWCIAGILLIMGPESDSATPLGLAQWGGFSLLRWWTCAVWLSGYPSLHELMQLSPVCLFCVCVCVCERMSFSDCATHMLRPVLRKSSLSRGRWTKHWKRVYREGEGEGERASRKDAKCSCVISVFWLDEKTHRHMIKHTKIHLHTCAHTNKPVCIVRFLCHVSVCESQW